MPASVSLAAIVLLAAVAAPHPMDHSKHTMECAKVCADSALECDACFAHCLALLGDGAKEHAASAQLCADCAACCQLAAKLSARNSPLAADACACCAKCCDKCAAACEEVSGDEHMAKCAKTCRQCADSCRAMVKMLGA